MHQRQAIRHAAKLALLGQTAAGERVYTTRTQPFDPVDGPGLMIYTVDETSEHDSLGPRRGLMRVLQLAIEVVAAVNATLDDALDDMAVEIERALAGNNTLSGACKDLELTRTQVALRKDGDKLTGGIVLTFGVVYRTMAADPTALA
jgi:hypothetical protein